MKIQEILENYPFVFKGEFTHRTILSTRQDGKFTCARLLNVKTGFTEEAKFWKQNEKFSYFFTKKG
jgi:hypothetical protein